MSSTEDRLRMLEAEIERRLAERFAALKDEFERLRLESDRRWAGFISRFDQDFTGIVPAELVEPRGAATAASSVGASGGASIAVEDLRSIDEAGGQVEILNRYLELCRRGVTRAALLITKGSQLAVWRGLGFSAHGGSEERLRQVSLDASSGDLARALAGTPMRLSPGHPLLVELDAREAVRAVLVPMVVKEKVSGVLYADAAPEDDATFQPERLAALTFLAGLAVDRLASRKLRPSPPLSFFEEATASSARRPSVPSFVAEAEPEELPAPAPPPAPALSPPPLDSIDYSDDSQPSAPAPKWSPEPPPPPPAPPAAPRLSSSATASPAATVRMDAIQLDAGIAGEAAAPATPTPLEPSRPSTGVRRLAGPLAPPEGNERHDEARRFARLLVSEIKLYNERAVLEGREHNDIYRRLKEDIDRSRQMYDERIPEDVRAATNFFHEELVRTLGDGREDALGGGP